MSLIYDSLNKCINFTQVIFFSTGKFFSIYQKKIVLIPVMPSIRDGALLKNIQKKLHEIILFNNSFHDSSLEQHHDCRFKQHLIEYFYLKSCFTNNSFLFYNFNILMAYCFRCISIWKFFCLHRLYLVYLFNSLIQILVS